jgi:hypothetical protein
MAQGKCNTCLNGPHDAWVGREGQPVAIAAGDHNFPANLPAKGDGECIRILRVENGSLAEITDELVRRSPREGAVPGTVIMLGSAVMLGIESVEQYATEWKRCRNILKRELDEVIVIPLLHLSPVGITDRTILRSMIDMASWYDDLEEVELKLIRNTRMNFMEVNLARTERGPGWADTHINSRMPVSLGRVGGGGGGGRDLTASCRTWMGRSRMTSLPGWVCPMQRLTPFTPTGGHLRPQRPMEG